jgi:hypothetical protein
MVDLFQHTGTITTMISWSWKVNVCWRLFKKQKGINYCWKVNIWSLPHLCNLRRKKMIINKVLFCLQTYQFTSYASPVFACVRSAVSISEEDFLASLSPKDLPYLEFISNSRSGQDFYFRYFYFPIYFLLKMVTNLETLILCYFWAFISVCLCLK